MSEVKIDVSANTTGAAQQVKQVDQATAGLAKSMDQLAKTSNAATDQVAKLEAVQRRLRNSPTIGSLY
jgi:cell division protein FtsB